MPGSEYRDIKEQLDRIENHLTAPGTGVFIRIDRIERVQKIGIWIVAAFLVAFLAVSVPSAWSFVDRMNRIEQQHTSPAPIASNK